MYFYLLEKLIKKYDVIPIFLPIIAIVIIIFIRLSVFLATNQTLNLKLHQTHKNHPWKINFHFDLHFTIQLFDINLKL
jgi:hypothetical protein